MIQRTITIEATYVEGTLRSTAPDGYTLHSTTTDVVGDYTKVWHTYVPNEAPTCNPTEADISRRVDLLREACACSIAENPTDSDYAAIQWGRPYIVVAGKGPTTGNFCRVWADATADVFEAELRRVAIRQLLAERGGK